MKKDAIFSAEYLGMQIPNEQFKKEEEIMIKLGDLFVEFSKLDKQHPNESSDFQDGIHKCQYVLGMRIARYYQPSLIPIKK